MHVNGLGHQKVLVVGLQVDLAASIMEEAKKQECHCS